MEIPPWCIGVEQHGGLVDGPYPFALNWEQAAAWFDCEHHLGGHRWEIIYFHGSGNALPEYIVRCLVCQVPRCGPAGDFDPCMLRRHHEQPTPWGAHTTLSQWVPDLSNPEAVAAWLT